MENDKRLYQRLTVDCRAGRDFNKPSPDDTSTMILDIGPEGIGFTVNDKLDIGQYVFLDIDFGEGEQVALTVQILWIEKMEGLDRFRVGAKVRDAKKEDLEKFVRFYCRRLIPVKNENEKNKRFPGLRE